MDSQGLLDIGYEVQNISIFKMFEKCRFLGPNESIGSLGPEICILNKHPKGVRCRLLSEDPLGNEALLLS